MSNKKLKTEEDFLMNNAAENTNTKINGALYGLFIGDALAMPVHWYYNREALFRDYGQVTDYLTPKNPHPDSVLWRSSYRAINEKGDILHDQASYYGQKNIHYHQFLKSGENTLNVKICRLLIKSIIENGAYRSDIFLEKYISFMTTPGNHRDTYVEECHRNFFTNYARGLPPNKCGVEEKHIGGLVGMIPIVLFYRNQPEQARSLALEHLALTHPGAKMKTSATLIIDLLLSVLKGKTLQKAIADEITLQKNPLMGHPFTRWLDDPDEMVIGPRFSTACYVEDSVPAIIYLGLKYHDDPERALVANTNLGGDNAGRGAVLGALLGAAHGIEGFPKRWIENLVEPPQKMIPLKD
jgi:ADP-ribosyl-[dinitrogen reductase] hydrolase